MKKALVLLLLLAGCSPSNEDVSRDFILPADLKSCSIVKLTDGYDSKIFLIKCPEGYIGTSSVYREGKQTKTSSVTFQ